MSLGTIVVLVASFASTGAGLVLAIAQAGLAFAAAYAARDLINEVDRVHAGLLGR
jgi:hypothetical protein